MTRMLLLGSALFCASALTLPPATALSIRGTALQDSLPDVSWDTTRVYPSADSISISYTRKWIQIDKWYDQQDGSRAAKLTRFRQIYELGDGFGVCMRKYLSGSEKTLQHFYQLRNLTIMGWQTDKTGMTELFRQFPAEMQKSPLGREITANLSRMYALEGANVRQLLEATTVRTPGNGEQPLWKSMEGPRYKLLVFGTSWCSPCKLNNVTIHETAKKWSPSQIKVYHLSLDEDTEDWLGDREMKALGVTAWLVPGNLNAPLTRHLRVRGLPHYYVLDENGYVLMDDANASNLLKRIDGLLHRQTLADMLPSSLQPLVKIPTAFHK